MNQSSLKTNPQIPKLHKLKGQLVNISGFAGHTFWSPKQPKMLCKWITVACSSRTLFTKQVLAVIYQPLTCHISGSVLVKHFENRTK